MRYGGIKLIFMTGKINNRRTEILHIQNRPEVCSGIEKHRTQATMNMMERQIEQDRELTNERRELCELNIHIFSFLSAFSLFFLSILAYYVEWVCVRVCFTVPRIKSNGKPSMTITIEAMKV